MEQWRILSNCLRASTCAALRPIEKTIAETRAALDAGSRSGSYWCDSLIVSRLAEAALAAGDLASAGAALQEAFAFVEQSGSGSTPASYWRRSVEQLATLSAWATEHRFVIKCGIPACVVLVAFGGCLQGNKIPAKKGRKSDLWLDLADARSGQIRS